jgi:hypothetical protein
MANVIGQHQDQARIEQMALRLCQSFVRLHQGFVKRIAWFKVTARIRLVDMEIRLGDQRGHGGAFD